MNLLRAARQHRCLFRFGMENAGDVVRFPVPLRPGRFQERWSPGCRSKATSSPYRVSWPREIFPISARNNPDDSIAWFVSPRLVSVRPKTGIGGNAMDRRHFCARPPSRLHHRSPRSLPSRRPTFPTRPARCPRPRLERSFDCDLPRSGVRGFRSPLRQVQRRHGRPSARVDRGRLDRGAGMVR